MRIALFCHSLLSDWNHGNAHFLRGIVGELVARGHRVTTYEPRDAWSAANLVHDHGEAALGWARNAYPFLDPVRYDLASLDLEGALADVELVIVHEWNDRELVRRIGELRRAGGDFCLFFHDTHHRMVTDRAAMLSFDLSAYDGILAFGRALCDVYQRAGWGDRAFVWHEAVDPQVFRPLPGKRDQDLVFIGNWGDDERTAELSAFVLDPVRALDLKARVYGVRYPPAGLSALARANVAYGGYLPNFRVPQIFAQFKMTVHVPRSPYVRSLPGIPTIRPLEALACGIPLVSAWWDDCEQLFVEGRDFLSAKTGSAMVDRIRDVLGEARAAQEMADHGRRTVLARHTCAHRVDELLQICRALGRAGAGHGVDGTSREEQPNA